MDMRSLNTSLPTATPRRVTAQPPEELLSAFKAAALSVTSLYKAAHSEQARARAAGYQDALDDILTFLDRENLGLSDGEGWRIRQWATERLDGGASGGGQARGDSDDEEEAEEDKARSLSPEATRKPNRETAPPAPAPQQQERDIASSISSLEEPQPRTETRMPQAEAFTFRSAYPYPNNHDRSDMDTDSNPEVQAVPNTPADNTPPMRVQLLPRGNRRNNGRPSNRLTTTSSFGSGAGSKRRMPFGDFFDISGLTFDKKDDFDKGGERGGKRGRHV
ncbi:hypothetical protein H2203_005066 [Taxawa tesnikishii (nom. ined.)]|nr:hypothetical protein H2203_005066 [Dothideales sp. JES 119]